MTDRLLYLTVVLVWGSTWLAVTFQLGSVAPELSVAYRAAYANVLVPIVALALSTLFEGFTWTAPALLGVGLVLLGNLLVLSKPRAAPPPPTFARPLPAAQDREPRHAA